MTRFILSLFVCWTCFAPVLVQPYRFAAAAATFNPSTYGTVKLRFSIRLETPLNHGDSITNLTDTINGWQVSQSTAAARPLYSTNVIGPYPAALLDGVNDYWNVTAGAMMDVLRNVSSATAMTLVVPTRTGGSAASNPVFTYRRNVNTSSRLVLESNRAGQYFQATARPDDAVSGGSPSESSNFTVSTPYVITLQALFSSGTAAIYRDTAETGSASYTAATTSNTASAEIGIGSGSAGSPGFYTGYIAEHIVWVPALSGASLTNAITDLRTYYGL
jgi:hypothetical protein